MKETKPRRAWKAHEIVDGKTVLVDTGPADPMAGQSVSDALQAAAETPQPPDPEELIDVSQHVPGVTVTIRLPPLRVDRLEQARALLELTVDEPSEPVADGIQAFKSTDGRTLRVVVVNGTLYAQEPKQ